MIWGYHDFWKHPNSPTSLLLPPVGSTENVLPDWRCNKCTSGRRRHLRSYNLGQLKEQRIQNHVGVSKNNGTPKSSNFNRVFHYKPSILGGFPLFLETPMLGIGVFWHKTKKCPAKGTLVLGWLIKYPIQNDRKHFFLEGIHFTNIHCPNLEKPKVLAFMVGILGGALM